MIDVSSFGFAVARAPSAELSRGIQFLIQHVDGDTDEKSNAIGERASNMASGTAELVLSTLPRALKFGKGQASVRMPTRDDSKTMARGAAAYSFATKIYDNEEQTLLNCIVTVKIPTVMDVGWQCTSVSVTSRRIDGIDVESGRPESINAHKLSSLLNSRARGLTKGCYFYVQEAEFASALKYDVMHAAPTAALKGMETYRWRKEYALKHDPKIAEADNTKTPPSVFINGFELKRIMKREAVTFVSPGSYAAPAQRKLPSFKFEWTPGSDEVHAYIKSAAKNAFDESSRVIYKIKSKPTFKNAWALFEARVKRYLEKRNINGPTP